MDDDEERAWQRFLSGPIGERCPAALYERVRSREPLEHRSPTSTLYEGLALYHQGFLTLKQLEDNLDPNEEAERSLRRRPLRLLD